MIQKMIEIKRNKLLTLFLAITTVVLAFLLIVEKASSGNDKKYNSSTVLNKIAHIQELALVKHNYVGVIGYNDSKKIMSLPIPFTEKYFLLKYNGYIKAGVDFEKIKVDVNEVDKSVHVVMPKAKILDVVIDENSIKVYNESDNAFNPIKISEYNDAIKREKNIMRKDAYDSGILEDANKQAKLAVTSLLQEMGFKEITVTEEIIVPPLN